MIYSKGHPTANYPTARRLLRTLLASAILATGIAAQPAAAYSVEPQAAVADAVEPRWSERSARDLLAAIRAADREGLTPADYAPDALEQAIASGRNASLDAAADASGLALARDFLLGHVQDKAQFDWHIERSPYEAYALTAGLAEAAEKGNVKRFLAALLPDAGQYRALRDALAETTDTARVALIRANMERWRWMPRQLGDDYLFVNIPTYQLTVMRDGAEQARYDVVVGAPKTPTPSLAVAAERVVVNPWWTLPPNVLAEGGRYPTSRGFVTRRAASGQMMVQQRPGPMNALGRVKIDMPNPHAIYLHDTPSKAAFARTDRALSHGCIRVKGIDRLAEDLDGAGAVTTALAGPATASITLQRTMPVYIVYMTAVAESGGKVSPIKDIYVRDARLLAALDGRPAAAGGAALARR